MILLSLESVTFAILTTSNKEFEYISTTVSSSSMFPSASSPSSEISVTSSVLPGELAVAKTLLLRLPISTAAWSIIKLAR